MWDKQNGPIVRSAYRSLTSAGAEAAGDGTWAPVRLASVANLAGTYVASTQTLTVTATGALSIDGTTVAVGDRILLKNQTTGSQNGIFDVVVAGATGVSAVLTRSPDASSSADFAPGRLVSTSAAGTQNASATFQLTAAWGATLDTTSMTFAGRTRVTQATSATTGVTANGSAVEVTTVSQTVAAGASATFTLTNSSVTANSIVVASVVGYAGTLFTNGLPVIYVGAPGSGSVTLTVANVHGTNALSGAVKIHVAVL